MQKDRYIANMIIGVLTALIVFCIVYPEARVDVVNALKDISVALVGAL